MKDDKEKEETASELKRKKIKENEEKFEQNNIQIKKLITYFNDYLKKVKTGFKINKFFNEFDDKAGDDLKALVKLSNERYKSVKSGNSIFQVLEEQSPILCTLIHSALNDPFYRTKEILKEKRKIKGKALGQRETNMISKIRNKLISKPKTANAGVTDAKHNQSPVKEIEKKNLQLPDKENIQNYLEEDRLYLTEKFEEYGTFLTQKKHNLKIKEDDAKKKFSINLDNLKYASSKLNPVTSVQQKVNLNEEVDTQKLIAIQKAQRHVYEQRLKKKDILLDDKFSNLLENDFQLEENNPLNFVKNEILKSTKFKDNILIKAGKLNQLLNDKYLPKIEEYENTIVKNNTKKQIKQPLQSFQKMMHTERAASNNIKDKRYKQYKDNYEKKKEDFRVKDEIEENMKKREAENKEARRTFLKEISKVPRVAQIYIDNYSLRDEETNKNIVELNRLLKKQNLDKNKINEKIDEFLLELEERKKNHLDEIDRIPYIKQEDDTNLIREHMRKNLLEEELDEEDNILVNKKILAKVPIDINNQTVNENFNVFKQFKERILDKKQEEIYKIKPMTAGEFLNENTRMSKSTMPMKENNEDKYKILGGVEGLSKILKEDSKEIKKILQLQRQINDEAINQFNKLSQSNKKDNPLISIDIKKKEGYFVKNKMSRTNNECFRQKNQNESTKRNEDLFGTNQQVINLNRLEKDDSNIENL